MRVNALKNPNNSQGKQSNEALKEAMGVLKEKQRQLETYVVVVYLSLALKFIETLSSIFFWVLL